MQALVLTGEWLGDFEGSNYIPERLKALTLLLAIFRSKAIKETSCPSVHVCMQTRPHYVWVFYELLIQTNLQWIEMS